MFEIVDDVRRRRRTTDGRRIHWYTISSPCEPNSSGELKNWGVPSVVEYILKGKRNALMFPPSSFFLLNHISNQRIDPVNAHLIPGKYSNTFILAHVYSSRAGVEHPLGTKF